MKRISLGRRLRLLIAGGIALLFLIWLALPSLAGVIVGHWLAIPGLVKIEADFSAIGPGSAHLRSLAATHRTASGAETTIQLRQIMLRYSLLRRHLENIDIAEARLRHQTGGESAPSPWPFLELPRLPLDTLAVQTLQIETLLPGGRQLHASGALQFRQESNGAWKIDLRRPQDRLQLQLQPGETLQAELRWLPVSGESGSASLQIARSPAASPARLTIDWPLAGIRPWAEFWHGPLPAAAAEGRIIGQMSFNAGEHTGELRAGSGELRVEGGKLHYADEKQQVSAKLSGTIQWQADRHAAALTLQPGFNWSLENPGEQPWRVSSRLDAPFALASGKPAKDGSSLPINIDAPAWGRWQIALNHASWQGAPVWPASAAQMRLQLRGSLPRHYLKALHLREWQTSATLDLFWETGKGLRAELNAGPQQASLTDGDKVRIGGLRLQAPRFDPARQQGEVLIETRGIRHSRFADWPAPDLRARVRLDDGRARIDGALLLQQSPLIDFSGEHALASGCGQSRLAMKTELAALDARVQPRPAAIRALQWQAGSADGQLHLRWCTRPTMQLAGEGHLQIDQAALRWEKAQAADLALKLQLRALSPLQGRAEFRLPRVLLATGTEVSQAGLTLDLDRETLSLEDFGARIFGGEISGKPQRLARNAGHWTIPIDLEEIDLARLLQAFQVNGLSGSGRLQGRLPLTIYPHGGEVRDGKLSGTVPGVLRYAPAVPLGDNIGLRALRDFRYRQLDLGLQYDIDGHYRIRATLEGSNAELYGGYPIRFGLNLNGALPGLLRAAVFSGDFNRHILEQLRSGKLQ